MNASIHAFSRIPKHLDAESRPHLVGKQVCFKYGGLLYKLLVGVSEGKLVLRIHLSSRKARTRVIDWNDPIQVSRIPRPVYTYASTWFEKTVSAPPAEPSFLDQLEPSQTNHQPSALPIAATL